MKFLVVLQNKMPFWDENQQAYVLNFGTRVKEASVKNFQLVFQEQRMYSIMAVKSNDIHNISFDS
jgi:hypothetical protein